MKRNTKQIGSQLSSAKKPALQPTQPPVPAASIITVDATGAPLVLGHGYNPPPEPPLDEAVRVILAILRDFRFRTAGDRVRAVAALLTPALVSGDLVKGSRVPMFLVEADGSATGKSYLTALIAAIYGELPYIVLLRKGGVSGFDKDFGAALLQGCPFLVLDNLKRASDTLCIESFMRASKPFRARTPRRAPALVDPTRYIIFATSDGFEAGVDIEKCAVRITLRQRRPDHEFETYSGHDVLTYVRSNQAFLLSAVHTIVREWIAAGRPRTDETRHKFREWAQSLDWILLNVIGDVLKGRLMDFDTIAPSSDPAADLGFVSPDAPEDKAK